MRKRTCARTRSRSERPAGFPPVAGHSLLILSAPDALLALFGARRSPRLLAIVRIHGTPSSVPGLADLLGLAHQEGWGLVVISGVGGGAEMLPRTSSITPERGPTRLISWRAASPTWLALRLRGGNTSNDRGVCTADALTACITRIYWSRMSQNGPAIAPWMGPLRSSFSIALTC